jgi:hypothetical protein
LGSSWLPASVPAERWLCSWLQQLLVNLLLSSGRPKKCKKRLKGSKIHDISREGRGGVGWVGGRVLVQGLVCCQINKKMVTMGYDSTPLSPPQVALFHFNKSVIGFGSSEFPF